MRYETVYKKKFPTKPAENFASALAFCDGREWGWNHGIIFMEERKCKDCKYHVNMKNEDACDFCYRRVEDIIDKWEPKE